MIKKILSSAILLSLLSCGGHKAIDTPVNDGRVKVTFTNPMINADVPDMSVIRVDEYYYMISTTMHLMPGAPVMRSRDLVNWETISYVFDKLTDHSRYDLIDGAVYGKGQWASSIRYHDGLFYVLFSPNDAPHKSYIFTAKDPAGEWTLKTRSNHFHDASLFFDDDGKAYVFHGTGHLSELTDDLSGIKPGGINKIVFQRDEDEQGLLEGSQVIKHKGKYYLLMISMDWGKPGRVRREVCYRADKISGPYEKKVILEHNFAGYGGVGQGCIVDGVDGNWYGVIFQDRGGIGRVPMLMPCRWVKGWPMLGDENGKVPQSMDMMIYPECADNTINGSDDFSGDKLSLFWQWNHNPIDDKWSLKEREGYLRLKTGRVVENIFTAPNTLTQRMIGPTCTGTVTIDISNMKNGDIAGLSAFNGHSGLLSVIKNNNTYKLQLSTEKVNFANEERVIESVEKEVIAEKEFSGSTVYLRIDCNFNLHKDLASFSYSFDNITWHKIGNDIKMLFDHTRFFMGSKFAIYNYATESTGGYIDVNNFELIQEKNYN